MIRRELAKDPKLAGESWDRFLPKFRKRNLTTAEKSAKKRAAAAADEGSGATGAEDGAIAGPSSQAKPPKKEKKTYTPFPPAPTPRKVSMLLCNLPTSISLTLAIRSTCKWRLENSGLNAETRSRERKKTSSRRFEIGSSWKRWLDF